MKNYIVIEEAAARLRRDFDWYHSFIRELYFHTPSSFQKYKDDYGNIKAGAAQAPLDLSILVASAGNENIFGIEFLCLDVQLFSIQGFNELLFNCQIEKNSIRIDFGNAQMNDKECWIVSKEVQVAFLGEEYLGPWLQLGYESPRKNAVKAIKIEEYWRQCSNCMNAWKEREDIEFSRCPGCGSLTKLE